MKKSKRGSFINRRAAICLPLLLILVLTLIFIQKDLSVADDVLTITALHIMKEPGGLDDPIWQQAPAVQVPVEGREVMARAEGSVMTRAVYTDDSIYFLFQWKDPTHSIIKQSWEYDGKNWRHLKGNEDRLAVLFEITRIDKFSSKGCAVSCHSPADVEKKNWKLATRTAAEKGDLWHWKAARSDPYGYADDAWLTIAGNPSGSYRETGRRKDKGTGGDIKNETKDRTRPLYMQDPNKKPIRHGFLLMEEAVRISDYSVFKPGDVIPYRLPVKPSGARFDVKVTSRYKDGQWNLMIYRKLDTGHEDDVVFNPLKRYSFAMAVFDDSGADHSKATKPMVLTFKK